MLLEVGGTKTALKTSALVLSLCCCAGLARAQRDYGSHLCDKTDYAELKDMPKLDLMQKYCHFSNLAQIEHDVAFVLPQARWTTYQWEAARKAAECHDEAERALGILEKTYGVSTRPTKADCGENGAALKQREALRSMSPNPQATVPKLEGPASAVPNPATTTNAADTTTPRAVSPTLVTIEFTSAPSGAEIELDGGYAGNTPSTEAIGAGEHTIKISKTGYKTWERKIKATAGHINVVAQLEQEVSQAPTQTIAPKEGYIDCNPGASETTLSESPGGLGRTLIAVRCGEKIAVLEESSQEDQQFSKVQTSSGKIGYIRRSFISWTQPPGRKH